MNIFEDGTVIAQGCPVSDRRAPCHMCGGGWPGTTVTTESLTRAVLSGQLIPERLGCGPLEHRASVALRQIQAGEKVEL